MARDKLTEYDSTAANNTVCGGVNIAENSALPSDMNNFAREIMSHLKEFADGTNGINVLSLADDDASAAIKFQAPSAVTATVTFTLPDGDGADGQALITDGSGTLAWAYPYGNRNLIINGAVNVNQRNADNTSSDTFGPDRYRLQFSGGGTTMSQEDMASSDTPYSSGFRNFLRIKNTTTTSGAGDYRQIVYRIEAQDIANSGWNYTSTSAYMTVSFWVRSSVAGKFYFTLETGASGSDKYYGFSETLVADTWKKVEHSVPGNSTLTFANSNARGLGFIVRGWLGTNYTDSGFTEDTWGSFNLSSLTGDDLANWAGTTNSTLDVVGLQMEIGSQATPFEHEPYGVTLQKAQRYYISVKNQTTYAPVGVGRAWSGTNGNVAYYLPCEMRSNPTVSVNNLSKFDIVPAGGNPTAVQNDGGNLQSVKVGFVQSAGITSGAFYQFEFGNNTDGDLRFDAEL